MSRAKLLVTALAQPLRGLSGILIFLLHFAHHPTGFSDPVYAEAYVTVHQYDIVLDVTVINRTTDTLQNLCLELATMGDLKLVERPQNHTLGPGAHKTIRWGSVAVHRGQRSCQCC